MSQRKPASRNRLSATSWETLSPPQYFRMESIATIMKTLLQEHIRIVRMLGENDCTLRTKKSNRFTQEIDERDIES